MIVLNDIQIKEFNYLVEKIEDYEEWLDRLSDTSDLVYDEKFHNEATDQYQKVMNEIVGSSLPEEDKNILSEMMAIQFTEIKEIM